MKRFLISIIIGVTFIAMGATMLFFEVKDFDTQNACDLILDQDKTVKTFDVSKENLRITFDGRNQSYEWEYDESLDDEVRVEIVGTTDFSVTNNQLYIDDDSRYGFSHYVRPFEVFERILEGLKDKKIYYCNNDVSVKIISSRAMKDRVQINHD